MKYEQVAALPRFDAGQYEGCEFRMLGGEAKLTLRFAELPPFEIKFHRARWQLACPVILYRERRRVEESL